MISIRKSSSRGKTEIDWLLSYHTFSFGGYFDRAHMGFRSLRVINDDIVAPGQGFPTHAHDNMEILTYIISGALQHKDSMGNTSIMKLSEVQLMSAGSGVQHSEFNPSTDEPVHLLQIWITPKSRDTTPSYQQAPVDSLGSGSAILIASNKRESEHALFINQDVDIFFLKLNASETYTHSFGDKKSAWLHIIKGNGSVGDQAITFSEGDGIKSESDTKLKINPNSNCHGLLFCFE